MSIRSWCALSCVAAIAACPGTSNRSATIVPAIIAPSAIAATVPGVREDLVPPWTLTASDGSGLVLSRVDAKAVAQGPLAFTELHLVFRNDEDRVREGTFQITLPARAAVARFAMENAGQWMEAEVVPRLVARRAYDDFLHRRQDPALLENAAGNQFTAKVFPIAPRSDKHLVISYGQELPGIRYVLPLRGLPRAERIDVELAVTGADGVARSQRLTEIDWQADRDFVADGPVSPAAVGAGAMVAAQIEIAGAADRDPPRSIALLVDTSASRAVGFAGYVASIGKLVGELRATWGDALPLTVVAFDQDSELVFDGRAADFGEPGTRKLIERTAAGASDPGQALAWLHAHLGARAADAAATRVVMVTDGVITAGVEGRELEAQVVQLSARRVERLDVVLVGGLRDEATAARLVRGGLARPGAVLDLDRDRVAAALGETVATDIPIAVAGAAWVYPRTISSARRGSHVMVFARMDRTASLLDVTAGTTSRRLPVLPVAAPLVERAVAGAELAELADRLAMAHGDEATAIRAAIAGKSVATRVLSSETSLLVLESDADYARYGIERRALADVLVIGKRGVERLHRRDAGPVPVHPGSAPPAPAGDAGVRIAALRGPPPPAPGAPDPSEPDSDHDSIPDEADGCPDDRRAAGAAAGDGCPERMRVIMTDAAIQVLDQVYFGSGDATIRPASFPSLDAVAVTLRANPEIAEVEVQGHADERGGDADNLELSERRAAAVVQYLVAKGVDSQRLRPQGYGKTEPVDRRHTDAARARNRRVAFLILRRGESSSTAAGTTAPPPAPPAAVTGELAEIQSALRARDLDGALARARDWHAREPGNVLALIGLGEALEARHADATAARIYGSIIDLFPGRADMRRFAGERLARLANASTLAIDTYRRAVTDRPDHLTGHRLLAYALVRAGKPAEAFAAILTGLAQTYRSGSYAGGQRVLGDDASMIGAVYAASQPASRPQIAAALAQHHLELAAQRSTRFVLYWETDANDVDLHVHDARGGHAFYSQRKLASGGELYADVTTGYGPECFAIRGTPSAGPYQLSLDYYSQGPMGYGMGLVEIQTFDPRHGFSFDERPYVIMNSHASVDLGTYR